MKARIFECCQRGVEKNYEFLDSSLLHACFSCFSVRSSTSTCCTLAIEAGAAGDGHVTAEQVITLTQVSSTKHSADVEYRTSDGLVETQSLRKAVAMAKHVAMCRVKLVDLDEEGYFFTEGHAKVQYFLAPKAADRKRRHRKRKSGTDDMSDSELQHELMRSTIPPGHGQATCTSPLFMEGGAMAGDVSPTEPFVAEHDLTNTELQCHTSGGLYDLRLDGMPSQYHPFYFVWNFMDAGDDCLPSQGMPHEVQLLDRSTDDQIGLLIVPENMAVTDVAVHLWERLHVKVYVLEPFSDGEIRFFKGDLYTDDHLLADVIVLDGCFQYPDADDIELDLVSLNPRLHADLDLMQAGAVAEDDLVAMAVKLRNIGSGYTQGQIKMILSRDVRALRKLQNTDSPSSLYDIMVAAGKRADVNPKHPQTRPKVEKGAKELKEEARRAVRTPSASVERRVAFADTTLHGSTTRSASSSSHKQPQKEAIKVETKPSKIRPAYSLTDSWSVAVSTVFSTQADGVYAEEDEEVVRSWAVKVRHESRSIAVVSPRRIEGVSVTDPVKLAVEFLEDRDGVRQRVLLSAWLHQLASGPAVAQKTKMAEFKLQNTHRSAVLKLSASDTSLSEELASRLQKGELLAGREALKAWLAPELFAGVVDVWALRYDPEAADYYSMQLRCKVEILPKLLASSGFGKVVVSTPASMRDQYIPIWLKDENGKSLDRDAACAKVRAIKGDHFGLLIKDEACALRVASSSLQEWRKSLGAQQGVVYKLDGIPLAFEEQDVTDLLKQLGWTATLQPQSRRCRRTAASWLVRSENEPKFTSVPVETSCERFQLCISTTRPRFDAKKPAPSADQSATTWWDACHGRTSTSGTTYASVVANANTSRSASVPPPKSTRTTLPKRSTDDAEMDAKRRRTAKSPPRVIPVQTSAAEQLAAQQAKQLAELQAQLQQLTLTVGNLVNQQQQQQQRATQAAAPPS